MGNIVTVQARLFHNTHFVQEVGHLLNKLLRNEWSYWVPVVLKQNPILGYTDIQYGYKNSAYIHDLWEDFGRFFKIAWVRFYDEGGDIDEIFSEVAANDGFYNRRVCYYGFDQLIVRWKNNFTPPDLGFSIVTHHPEWAISLKGRYTAGNNRYHLLFKSQWRHMKTLTSPVCEYECSWEQFFSESASLGQLEAYKAHIDAMELYWKGRLVQVLKPEPDRLDKGTIRWTQWSLDHWDNCVDDEWLAFNGLTF